MKQLKPQPGPQTQFICSEAEIAIYGGSAGSGKSFALLLDPLRHYKNSKFGGIIFRKTSVQVRNQGGLWDESMQIYPLIGGYPKEFQLRWEFPNGGRISFGHLEHDKDVFNFQGSQVPWIGFDELTHFSEFQFFYMLSRNRSTSGVKPRIRATCNPDPDSFLRRFIDWWIGEDGFPIPERSGRLRWFIRQNDTMIWADTRQELIDRYGDQMQPKSVTFISAKLKDNQILMEKDPAYLGNLLALSRVDRMRLLEGNWNVRASAGTMFKREWFPIIDQIPAGWIQAIRFWDRAATKPHEGNRDPDWTRGLLLYKYPDNTYVVGDLRSIRDTPGQVEKMIINTASYDSIAVRIMSQQDPGSAGIAESEYFVKLLSGYDVRIMVTSKDKITRAKPISAQCEAGFVRVLRSNWNEDFFNELENFPEGNHDDIVDVLSGAFNEISGGISILDAYWGR